MSTFFIHNSEIYGYTFDPSWMTLNENNVITFNPSGIALTSGAIATALGFTPTNPALKVSKAGDSMSGSLFVPQIVQTGTVTPGLQVSSTSNLLGNVLVGAGTTRFPTSPNYSSSPLQIKTNLSGSGSTGSNPVSVIWVPTDTATVTSGDISGLLVNMNMSSGSSGFRNGINITMNAGAGVTNADVLPICGTGTIQGNVGGTGLTQSTARGISWGSNFVAQILGTATNISGLAAMELDLVAAVGTSVWHKIGLSIVNLPAPGDVTAGPQGVVDHAINFNNLLPTPAWKILVDVGSECGQWPCDTNSKILAASLAIDYLTNTAVGYGVDFLAATFSKYAIRTRGFSVDPAGKTQIGTGVMSAVSTGLSIDAIGVVATAVAVAAGGTGYVVGDPIHFSNGGIASVATVSAGVVTGVTVITYPFAANAAAEPSNPVTTVTWSRSLGTGLTVNITWDASRTTVALSPSGGLTTLGGLAQLKSFTVSTLPAAAAGNTGCVAYVTDATSPTYRGALTGGGTVKTLVFSDGAAWTSH